MNNTSLPSQEEQEFESFLGSVQLQQLQTSNPLQKLSKTLLHNMIVESFICIVFIIVIFTIQTLMIKALITILLFFSVWSVHSSYIVYSSIKSKATFPYPVLEEMERHFSNITLWVKKQERAGLYLYPIIVAYGFMMGGAIGSGKSVFEFMGNPNVIFALLAVVVILVPICFYLVRYFNKILFGVHLSALKKNIDELKNEL